jgi:hypothetical protein
MLSFGYSFFAKKERSVKTDPEIISKKERTVETVLDNVIYLPSDEVNANVTGISVLFY